MPTGSGKTLIAAIWSKELLKRGIVKKIIVLEPTRILVEQAARFLAWVRGVPTLAIHGEIPKPRRRMLWRKARIAVATPETALSDIEVVEQEGFDGLVVDECHHTTGKDAYAVFVRRKSFKRRLGLSAYIPRSRVPEIEKYIGVIRVWSWRDERIKKYVPPWIGEIYEAELNSFEKKFSKHLRRHG